ncbi:MAG: response regulator [Pseudohongiella sp.]|nr:response regulator [Pseudohongiella sp.]
MPHSRFSKITSELSTAIHSMARLLFFWLCLGLAAGLSQSAVSQENTADTNIVVVFHSADFSLFKQDFSYGLSDYLDNVQTDFPHSRTTYEFLDLKNFPMGERPTVLIDLLKYNQQVDPASVVISVLTPTTEFMLAYGEEIYGDTPIVYAFSNDQQISRIASENLQNANFIPSTFNITFEETLAIIPSMLPQTRHLYVVSGVAGIDLEYLEQAKTSMKNLMPTIGTTFLSGLPIRELEPVLSSLPENSVIIMLLQELDRNGRLIRVIDVLNGTRETANAPIFSPVASLFPEGVVGGSFTDIEVAGSLAAEMAFSLLAGRGADAPLLGRATTYRFDQNQLRRWGIDETLLPAGSIIENQQVTFLELYGRQLLILLAVVSVLLFFVFFLKRQAVVVGRQNILFESVINSIPDAIFIADMSGMVIATNHGAEELSGFSKHDLLGKLTSELRDYHVIDTGNGNSTNISLEFNAPTVLRFRKKNSEIISGETMSTRIINSHGESLGNISIIRDISKRLSMEEEQRQGQKMEALGNLVRGISHDFNNILGVISGYAELSLTSTTPELLEGNQNQILKAADRAKSLVAQIMTFSRDSDIAQRSTDLALLLEETLKLIKVSIPSSIGLVLNISDGVQAVMGSSVQLQQIIINLTTNAYQAMKSTGGAITIALDQKQVSTAMNLSHGVLEPGCYTVLSISDTGPGMSPAIASRVFEPYFTTKAQGEGSGMGMAIVYNLVKAHGAMLDLKTAPGEGTCISLYFKQVANMTRASEPENSVAITRGKGEHILMADDEADLLDATRQLLASIGYQVTAFSDSGAALEAFQRSPDEFDLLLSDQSMPKITGVQLIREIRRLKPDLPAIICTGYSEVIEQQDINHLALSGVVKKPFKLTELSEIIASALAN